MLQAIFDAISTTFFRNTMMLVAIIVAVLSITSARATARRKQSSDLVFGMRGDKHFQRGISCLAKIEKDHKSSRELAFLDQPTDEYDCVVYLLNYFESLAVGIQEGILNEDILKKNYCSSVLRAHERALPLIKGIRERHSRPTTYQEFCWLAERWAVDPIKPRTKLRPWWLPRFRLG